MASKRLDNEMAVSGLNKRVNEGTIISAGPKPEKPFTKNAAKIKISDKRRIQSTGVIFSLLESFV